MKKIHIRKIAGILLLCLFSGSFFGCSVEKSSGTKVKDMEYAIVEEADIPEELKTMIEEKKAADFKLTYETEDSMYLVHGYGEQETGGYSICVRDLYLTTNTVLFDTELIGPRKGEQVNASPSFPYIVVVTEKREENIIFE